MDLINCQNDFDFFNKAISSFDLLQKDNFEAIQQEASIVYHLLKKESSCSAVLDNLHIVNGLLYVVPNCSDIETVKRVVFVIGKMSCHKEGNLAIYQSCSIPIIVRLLFHRVESVVTYAIIILHNLLFYHDGAKIDVRLAGGIEEMVRLLKNTNPKILAIVSDCLKILARGNQECKLKILVSGGPAELVRIMRSYTYEKLLYTACRVLKVLSVCSYNKTAIVESGGMQALANHLLSNQSKRLVQNCIWTIRNLSDVATKQDDLEGLLQRLVQFLALNDINVVTCSAGIISNLTCNNTKYKKVVYQEGGIEALVRTITQAGNREDITEPVVCALRHLTSRHADTEYAENGVRLHYGIPVLIELLNPPSRWPLIKAVIGLIKNLALCPCNLASIQDHGGLAKLVQLLMKAYQDIRRDGNELLNIQDGVRMEEIVEETLSALHVLTRDSISRSIIRQLNCIPLFTQLLHFDNTSVVLIAADMLDDLALSNISPGKVTPH